MLPRHNERYIHVREVVLDPEADVAVLRANAGEPPSLEPFWNTVTNWSLGEDFFAYGYPEDRPGPGTFPTARLFKGHFQRFMAHESHMGFRYFAGELSTGARHKSAN
jgi:hypothetical protein